MVEAQQRRFYIMDLRYIGFLLVFISTVLQAQTQEEKVRQAEMEAAQLRQAQLTTLLDQGVDLMESQEHEAANEIFKDVLKKSKVVPTDLTFYFGKNSFHLGKYRQSIDWLNKYIELKGTTGQYYKECVDLLDKANQAFIVVREEEKQEAKSILAADYDIDCGPSGKVVCPVCSGNGVIIQRGSFGDIYKTCPYSDNHGNLTCEEYNLLLKGQLKPKF